MQVMYDKSNNSRTDLFTNFEKFEKRVSVITQQSNIYFVSYMCTRPKVCQLFGGPIKQKLINLSIENEHFKWTRTLEFVKQILQTNTAVSGLIFASSIFCKFRTEEWAWKTFCKTKFRDSD